MPNEIPVASRILLGVTKEAMMHCTRLFLCCLAALSAPLIGRADEAHDLLKRVETTVAARHPILNESVLTIQFKTGKSTVAIKVYQSENTGSGTEGRGMEQAPGAPVFFVLLPNEYINPLVPFIDRPASVPETVGGAPAAPVKPAALRVLPKEKIADELCDVVEITETPQMQNRNPMGNIELKQLVRKVYIGQDGLVRHISGQVTWTQNGNLPGNNNAAVVTGPQSATFDLKVGVYRKPVVFPRRPDSQPVIKSIQLPADANMFAVPLARSNDGKRIALGTQEGDIRILDAETGREQNVLKGHLDQVTSVAFSPDGKRLVSADALVIAVWNMETGKLLYTLRDHPNANNLAVLPDGKSMLLVGKNGEIEVCDVEKGTTLHKLAGGVWPAYTLSPGGDMLAVVAMQKLSLWNLQTWQPIPVESDKAPFMCSAAFSPDGSRLAIGSMEGTVEVRDGHTGKVVSELKGGAGRIQMLWFAADGKTVTALDTDGRGDIPTNTPGLTTWDVASGKVTQSLSLNGCSFIMPNSGPFPGNVRLFQGSLAQLDQRTHSIKLWPLPILPAAP